MTPFAQLLAAYARRPQEEPFENYVAWHLRHGFVFSRPDFFCMGRPVVRTAPEAQIKGLAHLFPSTECNAWFIFAAAGDTSKMWEILPWPLGWVGWTRLSDPLSELQFVATERLRRLSQSEIPRTT